MKKCRQRRPDLWRSALVSALTLIIVAPLCAREARGQQSLAQFVAEAMRDERIGEAIQDKRFNDALTFLKPAATEGDPKAQALVGAILTEELGDHQGALPWLTRARARGEAAAYYVLARMFKDGRGVEQSPEQAHALMFLAATENVPGAQAELAGMYLVGQVTGMPGYAAGLYWAARASARGDALGSKLVALVENELSKNCSQARGANLPAQAVERFCVDWTTTEYATPARGEDCRASFLGGSLRKEFRLTKGAAEGWPECAFQLGMSNYIVGRHWLAHDWFLRAALKDHARSQYMLGSLYSRGKVGAADAHRAQERAEFWWAAAARGGDEQAQNEARERRIDVNAPRNTLGRSRLVELGYDMPAGPATAGQPLAAVSSIVGTWSQSVLVDGVYQRLGTFEVTAQAGRYQMHAVDQPQAPGIIRSVGIHSVSFDGENWQFTSEWQDGRRGTFYLTKVSRTRFEGFAWVGGTRTGPKNRWERLR